MSRFLLWNSFLTSCIRTLSLSLLLPAAVPALALGSEAGSIVFKTYSPKTYLASPQNWASVEDARGVLYFGNTDGLLEFDGITWRRLPLPNGKAVRSLSLNDQGVVFVGGQNEAGFLALDSSGATRYVSLLDRLDPKERNFGDVWSIISTPQGIYLSTTERLILYNPKSGVRIWKAAGRLGRAFLIDNVLHVQVSGIGLHRLIGEKLALAPGGEQFQKVDIRGVFRSTRGLTFATRKGFFIASGNGFEEILLPVAKQVQEAVLYSVTQISSNLIAFGTARGGLMLADAEGNLLRILTRELGLPSDYVASITTDRQGGIWLATGNGLVRLVPRLTYFSEANGLRGALLSLARWRGSLYAGTTSGLFRLKTSTSLLPPQFEPVSDLQESIWSLSPQNDSLWIGSQTGLFQWYGSKLERRSASHEVVYDISFSRSASKTLYIAMRSAAHILSYDGKDWVKTGELPSAGEEFRTIADDAEGILWASTRTSIVRADLSSGTPQIKSFTEADGLPKGWKNIFRIGGGLLFATEKGLIKFDAATQKFVRDTSLGEIFADGSHGILLLKEDPRGGKIWISGAGYHGSLANPGKPDADWQPMPFIGAGFDELWVIQPEPDGVVWGAAPDGRLGRLEPRLASTSQTPLAVLMRRLLISDTRHPIAEGPSEKPIRVLPGQTNLRVEFAAPFFDAPERVEYQFAIDGNLDSSAPWSSEAWKDLSNLWEGDHKLQVRARSPYGQVTAAASLSIQVLPPWYRTWWAYAFYAASLGSLVWLLFRWRLRSLRESNRRLESIVEERTTEIRQQRDQIIDQEKKTEALLLNILPAPIAKELRTKGVVAPMHFEDVTVCFTDFVGFTISSEALAADDLVAKLHEYFTEFDKIITRYGLEKLKTIGDSYMFVSGLPEPAPDHAVRAVCAALDIVAKAQELGERYPTLNWRLRVGLHSGPVVAGVVGLKKFAFDIWGDTVNLASRMESSGTPDRVNCSERTHQAISHAIECEARGLVHTKDGRDLPMYFAVSRKTILTASS